MKNNYLKQKEINNKTNNNNLNKEKENDTMMNRKMNAKEMRREALKTNGINVDNFFDLSLRVPFGAEVRIVVDGKEMVVPAQNPTISSGLVFNGRNVEINNGDLIDSETAEVLFVDVDNDPIAQGIIENGYVKNAKLFRRWITAQTFRMLSYKNWRDPKRTGWEACMKDCFNYNYQFTMMLEEIRVLSILQKEDIEAFLERTHFFNGNVVVATLNDYKYRLENYIKQQRREKTRKYRQQEYVKLARYGNVFVKELDEKVYTPIQKRIDSISYAVKCNNYEQMYKLLKEFMEKAYNKLPYDTPKSQTWKDAFKASGAYYTLLNLIRFHNVLIKNCEDKYESELHLNQLLDDVFNGEEWRFHKLLVNTIEYNNFDLCKSIAEGNCAPNTSEARKHNK